MTDRKSASIHPELEQQEDQESGVVRSLVAETRSTATRMEELWSQMTTAEFSLDNYEDALKEQPALLVTDCKSLHDAIHMDKSRVLHRLTSDLRLSLAVPSHELHGRQKQS